MNKIFPKKIHPGDEVRIIAPSKSLSILSQELMAIANKRFEELGLKLSFGKHVNEIDDFNSSSVKSRIEDLHEAFSDKNVKAIITVIGGFNSNQLLSYIDWNLIKNNPKIFCGYSDITALSNAIYAKTGLVTYSGPHYSTFGQKLHFDYTMSYFKKCLMSNDPYEFIPSESWSDDEWYIDQSKRKLVTNKGWLVINEGEAEGTIVGDNLCTFNLLQGTEYLPLLNDSILLLEDDLDSKSHTFDRDLQSLIHHTNFNSVRGIVIGRFQGGSEITNDLLTQIIKSKNELNNIPVLANLDFGHTDPKTTYPIGGIVKISVHSSETTVVVIDH